MPHGFAKEVAAHRNQRYQTSAAVACSIDQGSDETVPLSLEDLSFFRASGCDVKLFKLIDDKDQAGRPQVRKIIDYPAQPVRMLVQKPQIFVYSGQWGRIAGGEARQRACQSLERMRARCQHQHPRLD